MKKLTVNTQNRPLRPPKNIAALCVGVFILLLLIFSVMRANSLTFALQRYWGLFWITEETFTVERNSHTASLTESYTVESGRTYRVKAKITVYSATDSESTTVTSNEVEY